MKRYIALLSALALVLAGCSKATESTELGQKSTVAVNVHGVNYTAEPFRYVLVDPTNSSVGSAEHISPFSGGGITCCFVLPKRWKPGIRVNVQSTHWLPKTEKGGLPEIKKIYTVEVSAYPEGAGELWVLRTPDGGIELVTSNVEPDHPQWPGKAKGWPEPSLAYQRERWKLYKDRAEYNVKIFRESLEERRTYKKESLKNSWDLQKEHQPDSIKQFSGPEDPAYAIYQEARDTEGLRRSQDELDQLLREKP